MNLHQKQSSKSSEVLKDFARKKNPNAVFYEHMQISDSSHQILHFDVFSFSRRNCVQLSFLLSRLRSSHKDILVHDCRFRIQSKKSQT